MSAWTYAVRHLAQGESKGPCFAPAGHPQHCAGLARYRVEAVNRDTGEVRNQCACSNHAAWIAHQVGIDQSSLLTIPAGVTPAYSAADITGDHNRSAGSRRARRAA